MPRTKTSFSKTRQPAKRGRPKGSKNRLSVYREEIEQAISPKMLVDVLRKMYRLAVAGDVSAARIFLEWTVGRPPQPVDVSFGEPQESSLPDERLDVVVRNAYQRLHNKTPHKGNGKKKPISARD